MTLFLHFALAFVLTQAVEVPIYLRAFKIRSPRKAFCIAFGASAWTHPIVAFVIPWLWRFAFTPVVFVPGRTALSALFLARAFAFFVAAEGFAISAEALYFRHFGLPRPLYWSVIGNLSSSSLGALLTLASGWP